MKQLILTVAATVGAVAAMLGAAAPIAAPAEQPPIIDRNVFFGEIAIAGAQISPDGRFISFLKPYKGTRNIWVKGAAEPFSAARPVRAEATQPIRGYFWRHDSTHILYSQASGGVENATIYSTHPLLTPDSNTCEPHTLVHRARVLRRLWLRWGQQTALPGHQQGGIGSRRTGSAEPSDG